MKTLSDVFPEWLTGTGIFSELQSFNVPWKNDNIEDALDIEYFGNVSGDKPISPLIQKVMTGKTLSNTERALIASSIMAIHGDNWVKLWATLEFQYNPIENYSMVEEMTNDETVDEYGKSTTRTDNLTHRKTGTETKDVDTTDTRTNNLSHGKTGSETLTPNTTETQTPNLTNETESEVFGFNSSTAVPTGGQTATATGTNTTTRTGTEQTMFNTTETDTGTIQNVTDGIDETTFNTTDSDTGTQTVVDGGSDTHTRNYTLTRSGNIGVTTSQQMIESERNLWKWNFFRDVVFPDIDRVLTTQIYA